MSAIFENPYYAAVLGGVLIGLATGLLYLLNGRVLGISGIAHNFARNPLSWRGYFIAGLLVSGVLASLFGTIANVGITKNVGLLVVSGLLVGIGAKIANGCTSGHGIAGISRFSIRSFIAVGTFMFAAILTVLIKNLVAL